MAAKWRKTLDSGSGSGTPVSDSDTPGTGFDENLWIDQDGSGTLWQVDFTIVPASVSTASGNVLFAVNGWTGADYQLYVLGGTLVVRTSPLSSTHFVPTPSYAGLSFNNATLTLSHAP